MNGAIFEIASSKRKRNNSPDSDEAEATRKHHFSDQVCDDETLLNLLMRYDGPGCQWSIREDQVHRLGTKAARWVDELIAHATNSIAPETDKIVKEVNQVLVSVNSIDRLKPSQSRLVGLRARLAVVCWEYKVTFEFLCLSQSAIENADTAAGSRRAKDRKDAIGRVRALRLVLEGSNQDCEYISESTRAIAIGHMRDIEAQLFVEPSRGVISVALNPPGGGSRRQCTICWRASGQ